MIAPTPTLALAAADPAITPCRAIAEAARTGDPQRAYTLADKALPDAEAAQILASPALARFRKDSQGWTMRVYRLPGTDVYMAESVQGTAHCGELELVQGVQPSGFEKATPPPFFSDLCWTSKANFGRTNTGRPAFIETETSTTDPRVDVEVTPRTGAAWGASCQVKLRYATSMRVSEVFCDPSAPCAAAKTIAADVAKAWDGWTPRNVTSPARDHFTYAPTAPGPAQADRAQALLAEVGRELVENGHDFPTFGATAKTPYPDYASNDTLPLVLDGQLYIGRIGRGGVGWRDIGDLLFTLLRPDGDQLAPVAGIVVVKDTGKLVSAEVVRPKP